jgi:hypothetical protein
MATPYPPSVLGLMSNFGEAVHTASAAPDTTLCDVCDRLIEGEPAGEGVYLWTRGDEVRYEKAPLCDECATAIGISANAAFEIEEEDG